MAKITRIKASDEPQRDTSAKDDDTIVRKRVAIKDKQSEKSARARRKEAEKKVSLDKDLAQVEKTQKKTTKTAKNQEKVAKNGKNSTKLNKKVVQSEKTEKKSKTKDPNKKPFWLFRPLVALGHYLRDSWHELRQVRWPDRKTTWKMLLAVLLYSVLFIIVIALLDIFFSWLFSAMFSK